MARMPRFKVDSEDSWYHVYCRVAGYRGEYALKNPTCHEKMIQLITFYSHAYFCQVAAFCVMGNHYHLVIQFEEFRILKAKELRERAQRLYPSAKKDDLNKWTPEKWTRLNTRLFDISEFMRNIQALFAQWFNRTHERFGRFWAGRYDSTYLADARALQDCMLYVDLNPVRANLVKRPEEYEACSVYFRKAKKDGWLMGLTELYPTLKGHAAYSEYRHLLYRRGAKPTREGQSHIPLRILEEEERRGYTKPGMFLKRLRYFTNGIAVGSEASLEKHLAALRKAGYLVRRKRPVSQPGGLHFTLRKQRSHAK